MWEDPQQRLIQEQLDMMRDEEIIELQEKPNKTAAEDERLDQMHFYRSKPEGSIVQKKLKT